MFTIRYEKTGKEVRIDNKRAFIIFGHIRELEPLGWKHGDLWDAEQVDRTKPDTTE